MKPLTLLALSGSLRSTSYNTALIRALQLVAPADIHIQFFDYMADMPLFNPDLEENLPEPVRQLKSQLAQADGLIIASPEYAHGISGVMKNALDWLVSGAEFVNKPVALLNASPRAHHAQDALREVVTTMSGHIIESASIAIPLLGTGFVAEDIAANPQFAELLTRALQDFQNALR